ncbi:MAG: hypothetical protein ACRCW1_03070 [Anaerotignaceae bacterium]
MRIEDDCTYLEYKEGVESAFHLLGKRNYEKAENVTNYITDEWNESLFGAGEMLFIISIGEYEIRNDLLEDRVLEQLSYHIPRFKMGKYDEGLTEEEHKQVSEDIEYILSKIELMKDID